MLAYIHTWARVSANLLAAMRTEERKREGAKRERERETLFGNNVHNLNYLAPARVSTVVHSSTKRERGRRNKGGGGGGGGGGGVSKYVQFRVSLNWKPPCALAVAPSLLLMI